MVLNALLPEVFALVPLVKVELNYILVVTLLRYICQILWFKLGWKLWMKKKTGTISSDTLCAVEVPHIGWWNEYCTYKEFGKSTKIICNIYMYGFLEKYEEQFYSNWSKIRKIMDIHYALPEGQRENYIFKTFWNSTFLSLFENTLSNPLLKSVQE